MSEIWEGIKHFTLTKWEFIYLGTLMLLASTVKTINTHRENKDEKFSIRVWFGDAFIAVFSGWCVVLMCQDLKAKLNLSDEMVLLCVAIGAYKGVDTIRLLDKIINSKLNKKGKNENKQ